MMMPSGGAREQRRGLDPLAQPDLRSAVSTMSTLALP